MSKRKSVPRKELEIFLRMPQPGEIVSKIISHNKKDLEGYVIEAERGGFLTKGLFWYKHDKPEDAFVHKKTILKRLKRISVCWSTKPTKVYPAEYVNSVTSIMGPAFPFES